MVVNARNGVPTRAKISAAEMRMLRRMSGLENKKIRNECIQEKVGVTPIREKMTDICLRLFGHVHDLLLRLRAF